MSFWNVQAPFQQPKPIFGSVENIESVAGVHIEAANVGFNQKGVKAVPAGLFLSQVAGVKRFLPRAKTGSALTTSSDNFEVAYPELFLPGDVLYHLEPVATITLAATWAAGDTLSVSLGNYSYTLETTQASPTTVAAEYVAGFNASTLGSVARASNAAGVISIYSKGSTPVVSAFALTAGDGTATPTQFNATPILIGTIDRIDHVNSTIYLVANSAINLAEGAQFGTLTDAIYGLHAHVVDFSDRPSVDLNAVHGASKVYEVSLPYWDHDLKEKFPKLHVA